MNDLFHTPDFLNSPHTLPSPIQINMCGATSQVTPGPLTPGPLTPGPLTPGQIPASLGFLDEPVNSIADEFAESRFMMSYKSQVPESWGFTPGLPAGLQGARNILS